MAFWELTNFFQRLTRHPEIGVGGRPADAALEESPTIHSERGLRFPQRCR
jgi:hypothetical protein